MTTAEAQSLYDKTGSIYAVAMALNLSYTAAYQWLKRHGVALRKRGGWTPGHDQMMRRKTALTHSPRRGRVVSIHCQREMRPCVIHDLPGSCDVCAERVVNVAGISSLFAAEGLVGG